MIAAYFRARLNCAFRRALSRVTRHSLVTGPLRYMLEILIAGGTTSLGKGTVLSTLPHPSPAWMKAHRTPWSTDLTNACHVTNVDSKFKGGCADRRKRQVSLLQPLLKKFPMFASQVGMMRKELVWELALLTHPAQQVRKGHHGVSRTNVIVPITANNKITRPIMMAVGLNSLLISCRI